MPAVEPPNHRGPRGSAALSGQRARRRRLGSLRGTPRFIGWGFLATAAAPAVLSAIIAIHRGWFPVGDNALIGLRATGILHGHLPLVGQPSAGQDFSGGVATSHPGPIEFYLLAPLVPLLGVRLALLLGAAAVNAAAMAAASWVAFRRGGLVCMGWATTLLLLMTRSLSANLLHDPLSSSIGTMPTVLLVFLAWAVVAGDEALLPLFAAVATFVLQDHLVYLALGGALVVWVAAATAYQAFRLNRGDRTGRTDRTAAIPPTHWRDSRAAIPVLVFAGLCWVPVLVQQAVGHPGNLGQLWRSFAQAAPGATGPTPNRLGFAIGRLAYSMAPPPILHPAATNSFLTDRHGIAFVVGLVLVGAVGVGAWLLARARRRELALLAWTTLVVFAAGAASTVSLPEGARLQATNLRWMWIASAMAMFTGGWSAWSLARARLRLRARPACAVLLTAGLATVFVAAHGTRPVDERDAPSFGPVARTIHAPWPLLHRGHRYRVEFHGVSATTTVGPAIVAGLEARHLGPLVDAVPGVADGYSPDLRFDGEATAGTVWVTTGGRPTPRARLFARIVYRPLEVDGEIRSLEARVRAALAAGGSIRVGPTTAGRTPPPRDTDALTHAPDLGRYLVDGSVTVTGVNPLVIGRLEQLAGPDGVNAVSLYLAPPSG